MSSIDTKLEEYLDTMDSEAAAFIRAAVAAIPEAQKRQFIIDNCPVAAPEAAVPQKVHVTPYNDDMGVSWKLMFGDETVDDGFQSTADAEMWARDNGYIPMSQDPEAYEVSVCRTGYGFHRISVQARSPEEAEELALDEAGDHLYSEKSSEYALDGTTKL